MIDFLKYRWLYTLFSVSLIALGIGLFIYRVNTLGQAFNYSVDFTGGTQVLLKFKEPVSSDQLRSILETEGWTGVVIRQFDSKDELLVRVKEVSNEVEGLAQKLQVAVAKHLGDSNTVTVLQTESVGQSVGAHLRWQSTKALAVAIIAMLAYIAIRFWSVSFGIGAVAALVHDAFVMLLVFMLFNREISINVISAILAVLGYSVNDTIVIFSQIRKNLKKMKHVSLYEVVNMSLNDTFKRTLLTSFSTALTVGSLFILGGESLRDFSLALLVGIIFGTYSSIYIASPIMMLLYKEKAA